MENRLENPGYRSPFAGDFEHFVLELTEQVFGVADDEKRHQILSSIREFVRRPYVAGQAFGPDDLNRLIWRLDAFEEAIRRLEEKFQQLSIQPKRRSISNNDQTVNPGGFLEITNI